MSEEVKAKVKALFPEDVEGIYISKNDYDRLYGDLTLENIELKQEIERLNKELEKYKYTADELNEIERLNNIINELEKWLAKEYISGNYEELYRIGLQDSYDKLQELKGSVKE
jgi:molecular chaperone DnaK (HSP70)